MGEELAYYRDTLKPGERKRRATDALKERTDMLRPTTPRQETIYVACLGLLAWDLRDFGRCLAAAQARGATIVALNTGREIGPDAGAGEISEAQGDLTEGQEPWRPAGTKGQAPPGWEVMQRSSTQC